MIDYAIKPPASTQEIDIEKINNTNDFLTSMNGEDQKVYTKSYKYPYLAGEILSHDYPFLLDKIINIDFFGQENNTIGGELSMIKNTSNVDEGDEGGPDDSMGEFRNQPEPQEEDIIDNNNNNTFFNTTIDNNLNNDRDNLEMIDYLFNISFNYDLNPIQGGYLVKINRAFLHSLYNPNKSNVYLNYICFKKPNDIISNIWNKIQFFYFQEIIYDILMYCEEENTQNNKLDIIKNNILTRLIMTMKTQPEGIKDILCDYAQNCKTVESLVNENFLSKLCNSFEYNNEKIMDNFFIVTGQIIKFYKNDNFSSSKNIKPFDKNNFYNNFLNNSLGILNFGDSDVLIGKINNVIKEINCEYFKSTNSKTIFITFIYDCMTITRCNELLNNLVNINYFNYIKNLFFSLKNDITQSIFFNNIQVIIEDSNEKWLNEILIKNNFIEEVLNINYNDQNNTNNFGIKDNQLYIYLSEIFDILIRNTFANEFLKKRNMFDKVNDTYNTLYKSYIERMEKTICNFKCNSLYLPNEDSLRVDEIAEKGEIKNMGEFNRFNNNGFKKNSFSSSVKKEIFFDGQPEGDIEKREEDNYDEENDNENKNIIQNMPSFEEDAQKEDKK